MNMSCDSPQIADPLNETIKTSVSKPEPNSDTAIDMQECAQISGIDLQFQNEIKAASIDDNENKINEMESNLENYFNQNDENVK